MSQHPAPSIPSPVIEHRNAQPYIAVQATLRQPELGERLPQFWANLYRWLGERNISPSGAPFVRYRAIGQDGTVEIDVAVPVDHSVLNRVAKENIGSDVVRLDTLPAGDYATIHYTGPYLRLREVSMALLEWGRVNAVQWDASPTETGMAWAGRVEIYLTNPNEEPDPMKSRTDVAFRLASKA
jgi:effector-binding domain-containing protein